MLFNEHQPAEQELWISTLSFGKRRTIKRQQMIPLSVQVDTGRNDAVCPLGARMYCKIPDFQYAGVAIFFWWPHEVLRPTFDRTPLTKVIVFSFYCMFLSHGLLTSTANRQQRAFVQRTLGATRHKGSHSEESAQPLR